MWGTESWTPSNSVTIVTNDSDNTVAWSLTNPLVRVEGGFTVTKHVTGETGGYVGGSTFTGGLLAARTAQRHADARPTATPRPSTGLPLLTTCTLSERAKPATKDASYAWGTETLDPVQLGHHRARTPPTTSWAWS